MVSVQESVRLTGCSDLPELEFVEQEAIPESAMKLGIQLHLAGLSLADTLSASMAWVTSAATPPFAAPSKKPTYGPQKAQTRITTRLTKP